MPRDSFFLSPFDPDSNFYFIALPLNPFNLPRSANIELAELDPTEIDFRPRILSRDDKNISGFPIFYFLF
jgi:hypothetical protein